ncbi:delta-cadinene synthase isozyme XC1 [Artemisia annua]|uniref:Delta-cadinene synthase isozyme XC1 n=1 Tax=Artemisia annua TaxID=35608 RepID=A0A2U1PH13_ARTAN|nr:delta-cadinene synthase isozyme XC1 [Artemisia annua]
MARFWEVVGEVKAMCFILKLPVLYEDQGLGKIDVKLLGGLEVMVGMENENMASNVLKDKEHDLRRWLHKLRGSESLHRTTGRLTWITIIGLPISCWGEKMFKKIASMHGSILGDSKRGVDAYTEKENTGNLRTNGGPIVGVNVNGPDENVGRDEGDGVGKG